MGVEELFDLYEKAARWRALADPIGDAQAAAALRKAAYEIEREAALISVGAAGSLAEWSCNTRWL